MEYAAHVIERDEQVDRLFGMVSRQFQPVSKSLREAEELDMSQTELYEYHTTARQFERIADHAEKIADVAIQFENPPQEAFADGIRSASKRARTVVERTTSAIIGDAGVETASDALDKRDAPTTDLQECGRRLHDGDVPESHRIALTLDCLTRTAEYGGNIAEAALQSAASDAQL